MGQLSKWSIHTMLWNRWYAWLRKSWYFKWNWWRWIPRTYYRTYWRYFDLTWTILTSNKIQEWPVILGKGSLQWRMMKRLDLVSLLTTVENIKSSAIPSSIITPMEMISHLMFYQEQNFSNKMDFDSL